MCVAILLSGSGVRDMDMEETGTGGKTRKTDLEIWLHSGTGRFTQTRIVILFLFTSI